MDRRLENLTRAQLIVLIIFTAAGQFSISITHISGFLACALWFYKCYLTRTWKNLNWPLWIPFAAYALACILAVATALDPLRSFEHLKRLFEMGIFFIILNSLSDPYLQTGLRSLVASLRNTWSGRWIPLNVGTGWTPRNFFVGLIVLSATVSAVVGITQVAVDGLSIHHRISGTLSIYMTYAGLLMQVALVTAAYLLFRNGKSKWAWTALATLLAALVLTLTRQAWLGFGAGLMILLAYRKPILISLLPILATMIFWLSPGPIQERMKSLVNLEDVTLQERVDMWRLGWAIYKDYPVSGCGFHCLLRVRTDYPEHKELLRSYRTLHNNVVQLAVDAGTVGVTAWLLLWLSYLRRVFRLSLGRDTPDRGETPDRWVVLASFSTVIAFLTGGLFETNFYDSEVVMLAYYLMALPFISSQSRI